jgi:hypothetical protein
MGMNGHLCRITPGKQHELVESGDASSVLRVGGDGRTPLDLGKDWHMLHFLLTGSAWGGEPPLASAILGGEEFGSELGYGRARYLTPRAVETIARALEAVPLGTLRTRFDPALLARADVYPLNGEELSANELEEHFGDLFSRFDDLCDYYADAAEAGEGMLLALL